MIVTDQLVQTFITLVQIDNPLGQEQAMAHALVTHVRRLGLEPEQAVLHAEARSRNEAKLDKQIAAMRQACEDAAQRHGATVEFVAERAYGVQRIAPNAAIVQLCQNAARRAGSTPELVVTGGGSDVNIFNMYGIEVVNLSLGYKEIHSANEHIAIADLEKAARFVHALLAG